MQAEDTDCQAGQALMDLSPITYPNLDWRVAVNQDDRVVRRRRRYEQRQVASRWTTIPYRGPHILICKVITNNTIKAKHLRRAYAYIANPPVDAPHHAPSGLESQTRTELFVYLCLSWDVQETFIHLHLFVKPSLPLLLLHFHLLHLLLLLLSPFL